MMSGTFQVTAALTQEVVDCARAGRMFIVLDGESRKNEGRLVIAAQFADPAIISFMAVEARGLITVAITRRKATELQLPSMVAPNRNRYGTAFAVSVEAAQGVSTGISAADRARTVATIIDPFAAPDDLVSPGHVFPVIARDGGVLVRAGHTEASVEVAQLAGLNPSAVMCHLLDDDGHTANAATLQRFADRHRLPITRVEDLIAYRGRHAAPRPDASRFPLIGYCEGTVTGIECVINKGI